MNEELFQGYNKYQQDIKIQNNRQNENDQLVFIEDRSLNLHKSLIMVQISNDEKLLTVLKEWRIIRIYYLKNKKLIKNLKLDDKQKSIVTMKFSNNSRFLLFGDNYGWLGCFDMNNNYKLIYNQRVHSRSINNILSLDDDQILTSSSDRSLKITNIIYDQQLLKIENAHTEYIYAIDFDKLNDFIVTCSNDRSIKFFNKKDGKLGIEQQNAHQTFQNAVHMIQLIQKYNNLISTTKFQLILWQIDYLNLKLIKLKEFNNRIYNFTSVLNNTQIIVICDKCIHVLDKDLVVVQNINHNLQNAIQQFETRQLDSINYIIIQTFGSYLVLKKVRKLQN